MQVEVKIMSVELYGNSDSVVLNVEDKFGHSLAIELDEINVSKPLLDDAWNDGWSDYDTDVEKLGDDDIHYQRMKLLYEYLADMDKVILTWSERIGGVKLVDVL